MSDTHNMLPYWKNYNHRKIVDSFLEFNYFVFLTLTLHPSLNTTPET